MRFHVLFCVLLLAVSVRGERGEKSDYTSDYTIPSDQGGAHVDNSPSLKGSKTRSADAKKKSKDAKKSKKVIRAQPKRELEEEEDDEERSYEHHPESNEDKLLRASKAGDLNKVKGLLQAGADVNSLHGNGQIMTPLMWASLLGHEEVVKALAEAGADLETKCMGGWTALMWASREGKHKAVKALIDAGVNVQVKHKDGWNALTHATNKKVIKLLNAAGLGHQTEL